MSCRIEGLGTLGLADLKARTEDPERALQELAQRGAHPAVFHLESIDRFAAFSAEGCSSGDLKGLDRFAEAISRRVKRMPVTELKDRLTVLYERAYVYEPRTKTMALGPTLQQQSAKQDLDYLIAAIDRAAFQDELFLAALLDEPAIRLIMTLASPQLLPKDRGALYRLQQLVDRGAPERRLVAEFRRQGVTRARDFFEWFENYEGTQPFWESPWMRSQLEYDTAAEALLGEHRYRALLMETYPHREYEQLISQTGMKLPYERLRHLSVEQLLQGAREDLALLQLRQPPGAARDFVQELHLILFALQAQGFDRDSVIGWGWDYPLPLLHTGDTPDAQLLPIDPRRRDLQYTTHRLDEYQARFALLAGYRVLYERFFTRPLEETLNLEQLGLYNLWARGLANRSYTGIPIRLRELDHIRDQVQREQLSESNTPNTSLVTAQELGICGASQDGPLTQAKLLTYDHDTVAELICRNVEFFVFLPSAAFPLGLDDGDGAATVLDLFGIAVFNGTKAEWEQGMEGILIEAAAHEASHIDWFRHNFERTPHRLPWLGVNERRAYAIGLGVLTQMHNQEPDPERQIDYFARMIAYRGLLTLTNARLGLPEFDFAPETTSPHWDSAPAEDLIFYPGDL